MKLLRVFLCFLKRLRVQFFVNDISGDLPAEIEERRKQYEYYLDKLLDFKEI